MANPFEYKDPVPKTNNSPTKKIVDVFQGIVVVMALMVVAYLFLILPSQVDGSSMFPNLQDNQILLTNRMVQIFGGPGKPISSYNYQRGDIVVFKIDSYEKDIVKRVIGLPGERVMVKDGRLYINGQILNESYIDYSQYPAHEDSFMAEGVEKTVPPNSYFLVGDNRPGSKDSRNAEIGFVERKNIKGSPFVRVYPFGEFKFLGRGKYEPDIPYTPQ